MGSNEKMPPGEGGIEMELATAESHSHINASDLKSKPVIKLNAWGVETVDGFPADSYLVKDLARSGLVPSDYPFGVEMLPPNDDGQARYKFNTTPTDWKIKIDRKENKYVGPKGVTPPVVFFGNFHDAKVTATVEGYKKARLFYITTGIPTICIDGCWMFGESVEEAVDGLKARNLDTEIVARLHAGQHIALFDSDWATNDEVQSAMAVYRMLLEELGLKPTFKNMGSDANGDRQGYDDWFVNRYGIDRSQWPSQEEVLSVLLGEVPKVPPEALLGGTKSYLIHNLNRFSTECLDLNDRGAGSLLVKLIGADNFKYLRDSDEWVRWNGKRWECLGRLPLDLIDRAAQYYVTRAEAYEAQANKLKDDPERHAQMKARAKEYRAFGQGHCSSTVGRQQVLKDLGARRNLWALSTDFDAAPNLLGVANGVVDLDTGLLREETQSDLLLRHCPVKYVVDEPKGEVIVEGKTYSVRTLFQEITGLRRRADQSIEHDPAMLEYLQRRLGAALRGENAEQSFDTWTGIGSNGKSVLANYVRYTLGEAKHGGYATFLNPNVILSQAAQKNPEAATPFLVLLKGARIAFMPETKDTAVFNDVLIKQASGDAELQARGNYKDGGHIAVTFNLILLTNHIPNCTSVDTALLDRLTFIPFDIRWKRKLDSDIDPEEKDLPPKDTWWVREGHKQTEMLEYVLWWLIQGAAKWKSTGLGKAPDRVTKLLLDYKQDNDRLADWMAEYGWVFDLTAETPSGEVYRSYKAYIEATGGQVPSDKSFGRRLYSRFKNQLTKVNRGGKNFVKGIRLAKG